MKTDAAGVCFMWIFKKRAQCGGQAQAKPTTVIASQWKYSNSQTYSVNGLIQICPVTLSLRTFKMLLMGLVPLKPNLTFIVSTNHHIPII